MAIVARTKNGKCKAGIDGELTIYTVVDAKTKLVKALDRADSMEVDLAGVTELDTAGLQVLMLLKRDAELGEKPFEITGPSQAVRDVFETYCYSDNLELRAGPGDSATGDSSS